MKQIQLTTPTHGYPTGTALWVYPQKGKFFLMEDFNKTNQRFINPQNVAHDNSNN